MVLVDDHDGFRRAACRLLRAAGYAVIGEAATADAGLELARSLTPDVVVLDVLLPDSTGFDVAEELATATNRPQIVLISSRSAADFGDLLTTSAADAFITKADLSAEVLEEVIGR